jgi:hypothetical protein
MFSRPTVWCAVEIRTGWPRNDTRLQAYIKSSMVRTIILFTYEHKERYIEIYDLRTTCLVCPPFCLATSETRTPTVRNWRLSSQHRAWIISFSLFRI